MIQGKRLLLSNTPLRRSRLGSGLRRGLLSNVFTPLSVSGLTAWYDFSDISVLWQNSARTTPVTLDMDPIGGVTDKSGAGNHLSQATSSKKPTWRSGIQNGQGLSRFDGVDDKLQSVVFGSTVSQPLTIFLAFAVRAIASFKAIYDGIASGHRNMFELATGSNWGMYSGTNEFAFLAGANTTFHLNSIVFNGASTKYRFDGATEATVGTNPGTNDLTGLALGNNSVNSGASQLDLGEALLYTSDVSSTDKAALFAYLDRRWASY